MDMSGMVRKTHAFSFSPVYSKFPGNLHLNVVADAYLPEIQTALEPYIYEVVGKYLNLLLNG